MTAGLSTRQNAGTKVAFAPPALVGLIGAALLAGAMLGAVIATVASSKPSVQAAANSSLATQALNGERAGERAFEADSAIVSRALIQVRADERASEVSVSQALIDVRAGERASLTGGTNSLDQAISDLRASEVASGAAPLISEQEANRREHVRGPFAAPLTGTPHPIQHGPSE